MVSARKRGRQEMETSEIPQEPSMIDRLRNMWEFANLAQWIFIFGRTVKIDENIGIEELELECSKTHSTVLPEIGLALLKFVSSHRGLTPEIFDEYTRRQYVAKAPERNPYGTEEEPAKFADFDAFTKIRILQQLTQWTMISPERIRERMEETKDIEQTSWRIEPCGWDSDDREYYVLDDNRLYRRTEPPPPPPPAATYKKNSKKGKAAARASKRRKTTDTVESEAEGSAEVPIEENIDDGFGGAKWECIAVSFEDFTAFAASMEKTRDPNEKILRKRIVDDVLPLLEKQEEARKRKEAQKQRELINIEKLATAKRSSRIAGKMEQQKQEEELREAERKKQQDLAMAKKEQQKWLKLEKERETRMMTREQRVKEREARRILHEEELANLSEDSKKVGSGEGRLSERHLKAEIERKKQALEQLNEEDDWIFDCICGAYGQIDDGTHSIACEKCNIWQHSKCVGVSEAEADREDFEFICTTCKRRAEDAEKAKNQPPIKIKLGRPASSSSPVPSKQNGVSNIDNEAMSNGKSSAPPASPQKALPKMHLFSTTNGARKSAQSSKVSSPQRQSNTGNRPPPILPPKFTNRNERAGSPVGKTDVRQSIEISTGGSPSLPRHNGLANSNPFSSPVPHSPTSLPPPKNLTTNGARYNRSPSKHQSSPISSPIQQSLELPDLKNNGDVPTQPLNGLHREQNDRRSSFNFSSPLTGVPVLTPSQKNGPIPSSSFEQNGHAATPSGTSRFTMITASSPGLDQDPLDPGHASALPSSISGISPTKHSPPRPASNGTSTPAILPPIAPLTPSPRSQNLTPPIKPLGPQLSKRTAP
ncbi:e50bc2b7-066b-40ce-8d00-f9f53e520bc4 [Sclerotinia trifoliorum]|uniref:E50bc2b7-066b-40ce-8d00-f9f53e520bc4 n=1 Tax=Sclerotinia trifoliorum TaxID=28548 RepID=A0A8H2ZSQ5_9HELO|nr:e50bc2b7-066b-40ce-8d00-f9f53e520bc4 [Sclerotinia trifoliorum]